MNPFNVVVICITALGVACVFGLAMTSDPNPDDEYCAMVELYKQSNGENGWPAYKGESICK
jgi:hypothetical protein